MGSCLESGHILISRHDLPISEHKDLTVKDWGLIIYLPPFRMIMNGTQRVFCL